MIVNERKAISKYPQLCFCGFYGNVEMNTFHKKKDGNAEVKWTCPICGKERDGDGRDW